MVSGPVAMLRRKGKRSSAPKRVQFQLPTRDWQEEHKWERREATGKHPCPPGMSGLTMRLMEEPLGDAKNIWPSRRSLWWRRLIVCVWGRENPYVTKDGLCKARDDPCMAKVDPKPTCQGVILFLGQNLRMFRKR